MLKVWTSAVTMMILPPGTAVAANSLPTNQQLQNTIKQNPIVHDLNLIVNFLSALVGILVIGDLILGGIQYSAAGNSPEAVNKAKKRMINGMIALVAFLFIFAFVQWLIPGGVFK